MWEKRFVMTVIQRTETDVLVIVNNLRKIGTANQSEILLQKVNQICSKTKPLIQFVSQSLVLFDRQERQQQLHLQP